MNEPTLEPLREELRSQTSQILRIPTRRIQVRFKKRTDNWRRRASKIGFTGLLKGSDSAVSLVTTQRRGERRV